MTTMLAPTGGATFNDVRRRLADLLGGAVPPASAVALETTARAAQDAPTVRDAEPLEPGGASARRVPGQAQPRFAAFLDGAQWSLALWAGGVPVVHGTVAAVVRRRRETRLATWRAPIVRRAVYAPVQLLAPDWRAALATLDVPVIDVLARRQPESGHPFALQELAYQAVLAAREAAERELAEAWCRTEDALLFVDGGIAGSRALASSPHVVGVVKSHQRMYTAPDDLPRLLALDAGERSRVVRVVDGRRPAVAGWYLRLRDARGRDPFWGLVRVETALPAAGDAVGSRADDVSRWILAETLPLAVPDARWDKMVYGVRDCEEFLRAVQ